MPLRKRTRLDRRDFFRTIGSASTTAVVAAALPVVSTEVQAYDPGDEQTRSRYRAESPYVQAFYRTNGYETRK